MVHMSQPTILATIMNTRVLTTTWAVSATLTCYVVSFHVTPANCMAATTNQIEDGKCVHNVLRPIRYCFGTTSTAAAAAATTTLHFY